ncbi:MAG: hypothetical protein VX589_17330 [Myxococcota bacterium]|nr:hypothetical protein [Myxococcota bacterium]
MRRVGVLGLLLALIGCDHSTAPVDEDMVMLPSADGGEFKADEWDRVNDPARFVRYLDEELVYTLSALPLEGEAAKKAWPASYWPTYEDSTNVRWQGVDTLSPMEKYDLAFNDWTPPDGFMALKPKGSTCGSTTFDPEYYQALGPAARWMSENRGHWRTHDGIDNDGDGAVDECNDREGIDTWWGLCHAWTPAALLEDEPLQPVTVNGVTFEVSDLKALMITVYDYSRAMVVGGRCKTEGVERDENGRIVNPDCRDTNAGTFHVILTNFLGRLGLGFAEDRTYDAQVWNQPVDSYTVEALQDITEAEAIELLIADPSTVNGYPFNDEATGFAEVIVTVRYVTESVPMTRPIVDDHADYLRTDRYHYILELDDEDRILGGEWINGRAESTLGYFSQQPDFLWLPRGPLSNPTPSGPQGRRDPKKNPHVSYTKVKRLFESSRQP